MTNIEKLQAKKKVRCIYLSLQAIKRLEELTEYNNLNQSVIIDLLIKKQKKNSLV